MLRIKYIIYFINLKSKFTLINKTEISIKKK